MTHANQDIVNDNTSKLKQQQLSVPIFSATTMIHITPVHLATMVPGGTNSAEL